MSNTVHSLGELIIRLRAIPAPFNQLATLAADTLKLAHRHQVIEFAYAEALKNSGLTIVTANQVPVKACWLGELAEPRNELPITVGWLGAK